MNLAYLSSSLINEVGEALDILLGPLGAAWPLRTIRGTLEAVDEPQKCTSRHSQNIKALRSSLAARHSHNSKARAARHSHDIKALAEQQSSRHSHNIKTIT